MITYHTCPIETFYLTNGHEKCLKMTKQQENFYLFKIKKLLNKREHYWNNGVHYLLLK
jgi:hypothetical protein